MTRILSLVLTVVFAVSSGPAMAQAPSGAESRSEDYWMTYTEKLPIGSTIRVRTRDGKRATAVLAIVDGTGITVEPKTRVPEAPRHIPFAELEQLELRQHGSSLGKAVGIGVAVGVSSFFASLLIALAAWGD
jgi:hypothetical protein